MKKFFVLFLFFCFISIGSVLASESLIVSYEDKEITDEFELYKLAKSQKSTNFSPSLKTEDILTKAYVHDEDGNLVDELETYTFPQLLKVEEDENTGQTIQYFVSSAFTPNLEYDKLIEEENGSEDGSIGIMADKGDEEDGPNGEATAYSRIYWTNQRDCNGINYVKLTSANGSFVANRAGVTFSDRKVRLGASGGYITSDRACQAGSTSQITNYTPTSNSWGTYYVNYHAYGKGFSNVGAYSEAKYTRSGSATYTVSLENNIK